MSSLRRIFLVFHYLEIWKMFSSRKIISTKLGKWLLPPQKPFSLINIPTVIWYHFLNQRFDIDIKHNTQKWQQKISSYYATYFYTLPNRNILFLYKNMNNTKIVHGELQIVQLYDHLYCGIDHLQWPGCTKKLAKNTSVLKAMYISPFAFKILLFLSVQIVHQMTKGIVFQSFHAFFFILTLLQLCK